MKPVSELLPFTEAVPERSASSGLETHVVAQVKQHNFSTCPRTDILRPVSSRREAGKAYALELQHDHDAFDSVLIP